MIEKDAKNPDQNAQSPALSAAAPASDKAPPKQGATTGERGYDILQFAVAEAFIMYFTALLAYGARHGGEKFLGMPNFLKKFQSWFDHGMNRLFDVERNGEGAQRVAGALASTMVAFHGGNFFAPVMKWFENTRGDIVDKINKNFGKPGEYEIGHERMKEVPEQTWGDVLKGRIGSFLLVGSSFLTLDKVLGKSPKTGKYAFDAYEDWFGRKFAGLTKEGRALAKIPISQELTELQKATKSYKVGKIVALDIFATTAAITLWNIIGRFSAKKRAEKERAKEEMPVAAEAPKVDVKQTDESPHTASHASKAPKRLQEGFVDLAQEMRQDVSQHTLH